jgi:hypothetical protein
MNTFQTVWNDIQSILKRGVEISGWSREKGTTELRFQIVDVSNSAIIVGSPSMSDDRRISRGEFEKVYRRWEDYLSGRVTRAEMRDLSQNTSYIFPIIHAIEK